MEFLVNESKNNDTEFLLSHEVHAISTADNHSFVITTSAGIYVAKHVIVASGGMTYPQIGASPFAYEIAEQL